MTASLLSKVRDAIWQWDPYGVLDLRAEIPEEYDHLVDSAIRVLRRRGTQLDLANWVAQVADETGISGDSPAALAAKDLIWRAWMASLD